jgi:hypothetical protein
MFELTALTKAKLVDIDVLSKKNRPDNEDPGVQIKVEMQLPNAVLIEVDGRLRAMLFEPSKEAPRQAGLDGVEPVSDMPDLTEIGNKVGWLKWGGDYTGYTVEIDFGLGGKRNLVLGDATMDRIRFAPKLGGTVLTKCVLESRDYPDGTFDRLAKLKSKEIQMRLRGPKVAPDLVDQAARAEQPKGLQRTDWPHGQPQGEVPDADPTSTFVETVVAQQGLRSVTASPVKPRPVKA